MHPFDLDIRQTFSDFEFIILLKLANSNNFVASGTKWLEEIKKNINP